MSRDNDFKQRTKNIPEEYFDYIYQDMEIERKTKSVGFFKNLYRLMKYKGKGDTFESDLYRKAVKNFREISFSLKLDIHKSKESTFEKEVDKIINSFDYKNYNSLWSHQAFIEWCLKFVKKHPVDLSNDKEEEPKLNLKDIKDELNKESKRIRNQS
jgi:hypothetical protein